MYEAPPAYGHVHSCLQCTDPPGHNIALSGARLEGAQSVGGVTVGRLGDIDGAILGGVGHSEGVALGVAG